MTEKEAIERIKQTPLMRSIAIGNPKGDLGEALEMAIEALEKQIMINELLEKYSGKEQT